MLTDCQKEVRTNPNRKRTYFGNKSFDHNSEMNKQTHIV